MSAIDEQLEVLVAAAVKAALPEAVQSAVRAALKGARPATGPDLITTAEAGALVRRKDKTIRSWVEKGRLVRYGQDGERVLVDRAEVLATAAAPAPRKSGEHARPVTAEGMADELAGGKR